MCSSDLLGTSRGGGFSRLGSGALDGLGSADFGDVPFYS